jgi:hypothetical protein
MQQDWTAEEMLSRSSSNVIFDTYTSSFQIPIKNKSNKPKLWERKGNNIGLCRRIYRSSLEFESSRFRSPAVSQLGIKEH